MVTITPESKNTLAIINESKSGGSTTWAEHTETWADAGGSWAAPGTPIIKESKNSLIITNEAKP